MLHCVGSPCRQKFRTNVWVLRLCENAQVCRGSQLARWIRFWPAHPLEVKDVELIEDTPFFELASELCFLQLELLPCGIACRIQEQFALVTGLIEDSQFGRRWRRSSFNATYADPVFRLVFDPDIGGVGFDIAVKVYGSLKLV